MSQVSDFVDTVPAPFTSTGLSDDPSFAQGYAEWCDDCDRAAASELDAAADDRTPPPAAPAARRSHVVLTNGGAVGACSTIVRNGTIGAVKFTPAEAAEYVAARPNLTAAVIAPCACPLCVAGTFHGSESCRQTFAPAPAIAASSIPARTWETRVGTCAGRKPFEASVKTPTGRLIKVGKFASEAEAWHAANARRDAEKAKAA